MYPALPFKALTPAASSHKHTLPSPCSLPPSSCPRRFSCASREYKYYIVQEGSLDVEAMQQAAQHLLGEHDFRHFCKADVLQVGTGSVSVSSMQAL